MILASSKLDTVNSNDEYDEYDEYDEGGVV